MSTVKDKNGQPLIIADPELLEEGFIAKEEWFVEKKIPQLDGTVKTVLPRPTFTVAEVAKTFFAEEPDWLRWRLKKSEQNPNGFFVLDGQPLVDRRTDKNFRYYTLADIEKMAHALAQNGAISGGRLRSIVKIIKNMLKVWELID